LGPRYYSIYIPIYLSMKHLSMSIVQFSDSGSRSCSLCALRNMLRTDASSEGQPHIYTHFITHTHAHTHTHTHTHVHKDTQTHKHTRAARTHAQSYCTSQDQCGGKHTLQSRPVRKKNVIRNSAPGSVTRITFSTSTG
jgi:hypothetical protein